MADYDSDDDAAVPAVVPRRKIPKSVWLMGILFCIMGLRTTKINKLPTFELLVEESASFSSYYWNSTSSMLDFGASWSGSGDSSQPDSVSDKNSPSTSRLSLDELMALNTEVPQCKEGTQFVGLPKKLNTVQTKHRIPRAIHMTDYTNCLPPKQFEIAQAWRNLTDFDFYFHTNTTVQALLNQDWPEFPHMHMVATNCISNYRGYIDLWKALVLWEFGGVVMEFDWTPRNLDLMVRTLLAPAQKEQAIIMAHKTWPVNVGYMMEPKHPMAYYIVMHILNRINTLKSLHNADWSWTTGNSAFQAGWYYFVGVDNGIKTRMGVYTMPKEGFEIDTTYTGRYNRTARLVNYQNYVDESDIERKWKDTRYPPHTTTAETDRWNVTCMNLMHDVGAPAAPPTTIAAIYREDRTTRRVPLLVTPSPTPAPNKK